MFNKGARVKFYDDRLDDMSNENAVLRSKLQSKIDALVIMRQDYDKCCMDRDKYKLLVEQSQGSPLTTGGTSGTQLLNKSGLYASNGEQMLVETKEKNRKLTLEVESLKQRLEEALEDIKVLRNQSPSIESNFGTNKKIERLHYEREELVQQLEWSNKKIRQLQMDFQAVLDEKDELIIERDNFKCKLHRLNHELNVVLSLKEDVTEDGDCKKVCPLLDIDAIIMENRYLQERLQQIQAEKDLATQAIVKYKGLLECKRKKGVVKLGTNIFSDIVMSHKEVKQLLECGSTQDLPISAATIADLKSLSLGLLESLNDKSIALLHQRKTNRILATRITELEKRIQGLIGVKTGISVFPSKILLDNYNPALADSYNRETEEGAVRAEELRTKREKEFGNVQQDSIDNQSCSNAGTGSAFSSDSSSSIADSNSISNDDRTDLPPELEQLVQKALKNMQIDME